jgi:hypothetical protein
VEAEEASKMYEAGRERQEHEEELESKPKVAKPPKRQKDLKPPTRATIVS